VIYCTCKLRTAVNDVFSLKRYPDKGYHDNRFNEELNRLQGSIPYLKCDMLNAEHFERISAELLQFKSLNPYDNQSMCANAGDTDHDTTITKSRVIRT
jgi:hypothetical protein